MDMFKAPVTLALLVELFEREPGTAIVLHQRDNIEQEEDSGDSIIVVVIAEFAIRLLEIYACLDAFVEQIFHF